jgi:hypothetical protein
MMDHSQGNFLIQNLQPEVDFEKLLENDGPYSRKLFAPTPETRGRF